MVDQRRGGGDASLMTSDAIDGYLASIDEPKRSTLEAVRRYAAPSACETNLFGAGVASVHFEIMRDDRRGRGR